MSALTILYGFFLQPPRADPFAPEPGHVARIFATWPDPALTALPERPLPWPGTGWAPAGGGEGLEWDDASGALSVTHAGRISGRALWASGRAGLVAEDGRAYLPGRTPFRARSGGEVRQFAGHGGVIASVALSADGARVFTGSANNTARLWDAATGAEISRFDGHEGGANSVALSADGARLLTGSRDMTARLWDAETGTEIRRFEGHEGDVNSVALSADGRRVLTGSDDRTARLWDAETGTEIRRFEGHQSLVWSVALSADGARVLTGSEDNTARLWDPVTGAEIRRFEGHDSAVLGVAFSADGARLLTGSRDMTARLWDAETGTEIRRFEGHEEVVTSVALSADGARVLTGLSDLTARLWDAATGAEIRRFEGIMGFVVEGAFSNDKSLVLTGSGFGPARLWSLLASGVVLPSGDVCLPGPGLGWECAEGAAAPRVLSRIRAHPAAALGPLARTLGPDEAGGDGKEAPLQQEQQQQQQQQQLLPQPLVQRAEPAPAILPDLPEGATLTALAYGPEGALYVIGTEGVILRAEDPEAQEPAFALLRAAPEERLTGLRFDASGGWIAGDMPASRSLLRSFVENALVLPRLLRGEEPERRRFVIHAADPAAGPWVERRDDPAIWAFLSAPAFILLTGFLAIGAWREGAREALGIAPAPVSDRPIGWDDRDALAFKPLARALSRFVRNVDTRPPLTIAVTGGWGTGKSSLMNLMQEDIRRHGGRPVWFNAWHHREETHLLAALLEAIRAQAIPSALAWRGFAFRARLVWRRTKGQALAALLALSLIAVAGLAFHAGLDGGLLTFLAARAGDAEALVGGEAAAWLEAQLAPLAAGLGGAGALLLVLVKARALPQDPARLLADLSARARVRDFQDKLSFRHHFAAAFEDVCRALRRDDEPGLVIIVDDLDRCDLGAVMQVLEAVNYLVSAGPCFIVLGMDRRQIEHVIGLAHAELVDGLPDEEIPGLEAKSAGESETAQQTRRRRAYARHYLEKLVNIEVPAPEMDEAKAKAMVASEGPDPEAEPGWLAPARRAARFVHDYLRMAFVAALAGILAAALATVVFAPSSGGETPPPIAPVSAEGELPPPVDAAAADTPAPAIAAQAPEPALDEPSFEFALSPASESGPALRWLWWVASAALTGLGFLFFAIDAARRRIEVERDSPAFTEALLTAIPFVRNANATPRAVKRFENRMRYLAARLDAEANPRRPDWIERLFRRWLPGSWFARSEPGLDERTLILLGAAQAASTEEDRARLAVMARSVDEEQRAAFEEIAGVLPPWFARGDAARSSLS
ncbi:MAG: P-loop NTPase fold protein [Pikeienuella sp.]|uniref:P-loop NTPase fold protein n=1 Tax=Pikeienuella sp. TaxID=2831957 RepID=UPI00391B300C